MIVVNYNYLTDKKFLFDLHSQKSRTVYAKVTALNMEEYPIGEIQGVIKDGSLNLDGTSSLRRTCSLSLVVPEIKYTDYHWSFNTKFFLEIGLLNEINSKYPSIIWIPQGVFLVSTFSQSLSANAYTINISGKDKMCLLNGEQGGTIHDLEVDFSVIDEYDKVNNVTVKRKLTLREIIYNLLLDYGHEKPENIVINDLDEYGLELLEYRGDEPIYFYSSVKSDPSQFSGEYVNLAYSKSSLSKFGLSNNKFKDLEELSASNSNVEKCYIGTDSYYKIKKSAKEYYQIKEIEYGMAAGYQVTNLTYAGDLVASLGNSITSILDKIKNMLAHFEYYYNVNGQFVFQRKRSFQNSTWNSITKNPIITEFADYDYEFNNSEFLQSISITPQLNSVKNDYSIWSTRTGVSGAEVPIHLRYAIDHKPQKYTSIKVTKDEVDAIPDYSGSKESQSSVTYSTSNYDWREIIYRMAKDYVLWAKYLPDFEYKVLSANINNGYLSGKTGYEPYYIDIYNFWRDLYDPDGEKKDFEFTNTKSLKSNTYAFGYIKESSKDSIKTYLKQSEEQINFDKYKVFKHGGMQNWLDTLNIYKETNKNYFIKRDSETCILKKLSNIQIKYLDWKTRENGYYTKTSSNGKINVFKKNKQLSELIFYIKQGKTYKKKNYSDIQTMTVSKVYYKENNEYKLVKDLLISLSTSFSLFYKSSNGTIYTAIDRNSDYVNANKLSVYYSSNIPWWQAYVSQSSFGTLYKEEDNTLENNNGLKKIQKDNNMEKIYLTSNGKLRKYFYTYQFNAYGNPKAQSKAKQNITYYKGIERYFNSDAAGDLKYWNKQVFQSPELLNFWFDFLDCHSSIEGDIDGDMDKYSVPAIGTRSFTTSAGDVADSVFYSQIPNIIFTTKPSNDPNRKQHQSQFVGYHFIYTTIATNELFQISSQKKSLQDVLDENLFKSSYCTENVNITMVPFYHFVPNTKLFITDKKTNISGIYEISRISFPFNHSGSSSLTTVKYVEQLY